MVIDNLFFVLLIFLFCFFGMFVLIFRKIIKIHLATYELLEHAKVTRQETEAMFSQLQALQALEKKLSLLHPLPPMRGWAGSPDFLSRVADQISEQKPATVMECSSGVSTLVVARSLQLIGTGHVYSLEHDPVYAAKTRKLLEQNGLLDWATVLVAPLEKKEMATPWYSEDVIPAGMPAIDLLIIDGPPTAAGRLARYPALPRLYSRMSQHAVIIADDTARSDETEMLKKWANEFPQFEQIDLYCEKGCTLLKMRAQ